MGSSTDTADTPSVSYASPLPLERPRRSWRHIVLFLLTVATTTLVGADHFFSFYRDFGNRAADMTGSALILNGLWYSVSILGILGCHEMGHYVLNHIPRMVGAAAAALLTSLFCQLRTGSPCVSATSPALGSFASLTRRRLTITSASIQTEICPESSRFVLTQDSFLLRISFNWFLEMRKVLYTKTKWEIFHGHRSTDASD